MTNSTQAAAYKNNFGAIRLFAALLVIFGHGRDLKGLPPPILWNTQVSQIGLDIFFSVSGYLIYDSWLRNPRLRSFLVKRALRIVPGLLACVLVCAFVIGSLATDLPLRAYLGHHVTWQYLLNVVFYLKLYLPGVFQDRLLLHAVNGSLWSLLPEVLCYLAIPVIWLAAPWARSTILVAVMVCCGAGGLYLFIYHPTGYSLIYGADPKYILVQVPFFMAGALWRQVQLRAPALFRMDVAVMFTAVTFLLPTLIGDSSGPVRWLTFSYVLIAFGTQSTPVLRQATRFGDLSYGAYLYAFPIQQLVLDHVRSYAIAITIAGSLIVAWLSWHLVEQPALRLKPRRGTRPDAELGRVSTIASSVLPSLGSKPDWRAAWRRVRWLAGSTPLLPGLAAFLCLAAYAGQIGLGRWQIDEYMLFTDLHNGGWTAVLPRLEFSPRPFSEALLFLYGLAVLSFHSPLVIPFLAFLWTCLLGFTVLAARNGLPPSGQRWSTAAVLVGSLLVFVLTTNNITEVFYWPMAAAAYLPTAGSAVVLLFLLSSPLTPRRRLACGAALLVAAASSEFGAALAVSFAAAALVMCCLGGWVHVIRGLRDGAWWLMPALLGIAVLGVVVLERAHSVRQGAEAAPSAGHIVTSLMIGMHQFMLDVAGSSIADRPFFAALIAKLLFALGFAAVWRRADPGALSPWHAVLAVALGAATLFSIVAAYDHYGTLCCERQATTRSWFIDLIAIMLIGWVLSRWQAWRRIAWLAPALLTLSLYPSLSNYRGLRGDYANYGFAIDSRVQTWDSAKQPGTNMEFYISPDRADMLIRGYSQPIGTYRIGSGAPELATAVGRFFEKDVVVTCQPWQTHETWLINGQFIPACPPHLGPIRVIDTRTQ